MPISFKTQVVTVIRPAWIEERGTRIPDWDNATEHQLPGCRVQPIVGDELHGNRDAIITRWRFSGPPTADIQSTDRVRHADTLYAVEGSIQQWPSPTGALASTQAVLERVEG